MTTDPFPKYARSKSTHRRGRFRVGGMAKGSGMIEPRMATMLGYLTTDAAVEPAMLRRALADACRYTFNAITVDGERSTNDCVFALANGDERRAIDEALYPALFEGFAPVALELALGIVRGGEGATKLVAITVTGAATDDEAWMAARAIANSPLVKTAVHGGDPNWGRLVAAAGRSGAAFSLDRAPVRIGSLVLFSTASRTTSARREAAEYLQGTTLEIEVNVGAGGTGRATVYTCDLSAEYVKINAEYRHLRRSKLDDVPRVRSRTFSRFSTSLTTSCAQTIELGIAHQARAPAGAARADRTRARRASYRAAVRETVAAHARDLHHRRARAGRRHGRDPGRRDARRPRADPRCRAQPRTLGGRRRHPHVRPGSAGADRPDHAAARM